MGALLAPTAFGLCGGDGGLKERAHPTLLRLRGARTVPDNIVTPIPKSVALTPSSGFILGTYRIDAESP